MSKRDRQERREQRAALQLRLKREPAKSRRTSCLGNALYRCIVVLLVLVYRRTSCLGNALYRWVVVLLASNSIHYTLGRVAWGTHCTGIIHNAL
jgi:hypothetical protein